MEHKDRIYISEDYRSLIAKMIEKDLLGFDKLEAKDIFALAVALGMDSPQELRKKEGYVRTQYLKPLDQAIIKTLLLNKANNDDEIDQYSDFDMAIDLAEKAAENGFRVLQNKVDDAGGDRELLERKMLQELDSLYMKNVENDI